MKINSRYPLLALIIAGITGCTRPVTGPDKISSASDSVITMKGSESELKLLIFFSEGFKKEQPGISMNITGGGSGVGLEALIAGETEIANSSRLMSEAEYDRAKTNGITPVPITIALDAIAIITHPEIGIDSLSLRQLAKIFDGTITNWEELGGKNVPVHIYGRNENSGTHHYLLTRLNMNDYSPATEIKNGNAEIIKAVQEDKGGIGYVSLGSIMENDGKPFDSIWAVNTYFDGGRAHSPYEKEAVISGEYPLARPLFQYIDKNSGRMIRELLRFELSESEQAQIGTLGYFPITSIYKTINKKNGFE